MDITLDPQLEAALSEEARRQGVAPEALALEVLRARFLALKPVVESGDEWVRRLRAIAGDAGVSLSDEAVSSEGIYE